VKRPLLFLLAALAVLSAPRLSAAAPVFTMTIDTIWVTGDTRYLYEDPSIIPTGVPRGGSSELIFPLNTLVEGLRFHYVPASQERLRWALEVSFHTNLIDTYGLMQDYDWWMYPGIPKVPFNYTESPAAMRWYLAAAEAQFNLSSGEWGKVALAFGYRFQFINQRITSGNGWSLDTNLDGTLEPRTPDQFNVYALDYRIFYNTVTAGMNLILNPASPVSITAEAGFALPYVYDRDNHILRHKLSTASGIGYGGIAGLEARYTWSPASSRLRPFVALSSSGLWLFANTLQTQYWYGDDPFTPWDDTGNWISGIDHRISTRQYRVAFILGLQF
jgi:hypothetical protein